MENIEWWVEYDFNCNNNRPDKIRMFNNEQKAIEFSKTTSDGRIVMIERIYQ